MYVSNLHITILYFEILIFQKFQIWIWLKSHLNELFINATTDETQRDLYVWHDGQMPDGCALESFSTSNGTSIIEYQVPNEACSRN